jgi:hypothetical protein
MLSKERKAEIARENGAKSKGPVTPEGKSRSRRNAITHGERASALKFIIPPHSACLGNELRQGFYRLLDQLIAKYRPADEIEMQIVREMADYNWKSIRNKQMETAIFNRELIRQAARIQPSMPELRDIEISVAAHEALTGNRTILELRRDTQVCLRTLSLLQRRLRELQKNWAPAAPIPPAAEQNTTPVDGNPEDDEGNSDERTGPKSTEFHVNGPVTDNVIHLYREIFHKDSLNLVGHDPIPDLKAA